MCNSGLDLNFTAPLLSEYLLYHGEFHLIKFYFMFVNLQGGYCS